MNITAPEKLGFSSERLARIAPVMQSFVDNEQVAGILTLAARRGELAHFERFGKQDLSNGKAMDYDTIFRIYSMSKPITSAAVMMLFEEDRFRLTDPISKYIPAFKKMKVIASQSYGKVDLVDAARDITIRDLFTHSSGLSYGFDPNDYLDQLYQKRVWRLRQTRPESALVDVVEAVAKLPLRFHPGSKFHYSFSIDVLGHLVEVITGMPFDRFLQERIFDPLGMVDTGFWVPPEKVSRLAAMYGPDEKKSGKLKDIDPNQESEYTRPAKFLSGGGGLVSTALDYLAFCQMLLNKGQYNGVRLLGRKTVEFMFQNHLPSGIFLDNDPSRGFGFGLGGSVVLDEAKTQMMGSNGTWAWGGAANTKFWIDPQEQLIGIMMLQFMPSDLHVTEANFRNLVYQAIVD